MDEKYKNVLMNVHGAERSLVEDKGYITLHEVIRPTLRGDGTYGCDYVHLPEIGKALRRRRLRCNRDQCDNLCPFRSGEAGELVYQARTIAYENTDCRRPKQKVDIEGIINSAIPELTPTFVEKLPPQPSTNISFRHRVLYHLRQLFSSHGQARIEH